MKFYDKKMNLVVDATQYEKFEVVPDDILKRPVELEPNEWLLVYPNGEKYKLTDGLFKERYIPLNEHEV